MSARPKTSDEEIRTAARKVVEKDGVENLSMQAIAEAVGVRAPSLYKRFASRGDLLQAVTEDALAELKGSLESVPPGSPLQTLERMANAYRAFAKCNPRVYGLILDGGSSSPDVDSVHKARVAAASSLFQILSEEVGQERALLAARTLVAFLHGFVSMELNGAFHFGGDIDAAFQFGLATILGALVGTGNKTGRRGK